MAEYISDLGYTYTDEEINKAAKEQGKTVAEIMQKHNLKPASADKSMEESADMEIDGPGKKKGAAPTPTAAPKNTAFSSDQSSLGSQKTPFSNVNVTKREIKEPIVKDNKKTTPKPVITGAKKPIAIPENWQIRKDGSWWESKNLTETEAVKKLDKIINGANLKGKDFTIEESTPLVDAVRIKSNLTGKEISFNISDLSSGAKTQTEIENALGGGGLSLSTLNNWVNDNSRYNTKNKKQKDIYKRYGLNEEELINAGNGGALDFWGVAKEVAGLPIDYVKDKFDPAENRVTQSLGNIVRMTSNAANAKPLYDANDDEDTKFNKVAAVAGKVQSDVSKAVDAEIDTNPMFKENSLLKIVDNKDLQEKFVNGFIAKNSGLIVNSGFNEKAIRSFVTNSVKAKANEVSAEYSKQVSESMSTKDLGSQVNYYRDRQAKQYDPEDKEIYTAWRNIDNLNQELYNLKSKVAKSNDPNIQQQIANTEERIAAAKTTAEKLSGAKSEYNRFLYNPTTAKVAKVKEGKIAEGSTGAVDLTDKVNTYSQIYKGTTQEKLAKVFVKYNSELEYNNADGNKKISVVLDSNSNIIRQANLNGWNVKALPNKQILISGVPKKTIAGMVDNPSWITSLPGMESEKGGGILNFYSYDPKSKNGKGKKIDAELNTWKERNIDLKANTIAINDMFLLNKGVTSNVEGFWGNVAQGVKKSFNENYQTTEDKINRSKSILGEANVKLSEKTEKELIPGFIPSVGFIAGSGLKTVAEIGAAEFASGGLATFALGARGIEAYRALKTSEKLADRAFFYATEALGEEATMRGIGMEEGSGTGFWLGKKILPKSYGFLDPYKYRGINNVSNIVGHAVNGGINMEIAAGIENGYKAITGNEKFKDYIDRDFKDFSQVTKRVFGNALAFSYMGAPKMFSPYFFKSGAEVQRALSESNAKVNDVLQQITTFKSENSPSSEGYKEGIKELKKSLDKAKSVQMVAAQANMALAQDMALNTDEGLENYIVSRNKKFFDKYAAEQGHNIDIKLTDGNPNESGQASSFVPPKYNESGEIIENGKLIFNKNQIRKNGFINDGLLTHEVGHLVDHVEVENKVREFSKTEKDPEKIKAYRDQLEGNKNEQIVEILAKNFPDIMDASIYVVTDKKTGEKRKVNIVEAMNDLYSDKSKAEINDEIVKRVIEELGTGINLRSPLKARSTFRNLLVDFNNIINKGKEIDYNIKSADELINLLSNYSQSFKNQDRPYEYSQALAKIDLSNFVDAEFANADVTNPENIAKYEAVVEAKQQAEESFNNKPKESRDIETEIDNLYDDYANSYIDEATFNKKLAELEAKEKGVVIAEKPIEAKTSAKEASVDEKKLGNTIDNLVGPKDSNGRYKMTKEEWDKGGILKAKEQLIDGRILEPLIKKELTRNGVSADNVHGVDIATFMEDAKNRIFEAALLKFNPEVNNSLGGFILGSQFGLRNKVGDIANKYKKQLSTKSIDVGEGETGYTKELMSEEEADFNINQEEQKYKPKFKTLEEYEVVDNETLANIKRKIVPITRTLKNKVGSKTSNNRSIDPLIKEIIDNISTQADIDLKTAMGGKKDNQLVNWLIKNKKAVLENATTTFLMGKATDKGVLGGFPEAIQKRVNGVWLSYPDYIGKKPDRSSVNEGNIGNTSGDIMVRRTPDVANAVSNEAFLARVIDPKTGNPLRGAKESLSKHVAGQLGAELARKEILSGMEKLHDMIEIEEISPDKRTPAQSQRLEALDAQIKNENPIFDAFRKNQEALGAIMANVQESEIIRIFEQGNKKESREQETIDSDYKLLFDKLDSEVEAAKTLAEKSERISDFLGEKSKPLRTIAAITAKGRSAIGKTNRDIYKEIISPILETQKLKGFDLNFSLNKSGNSILYNGENTANKVFITKLKYDFPNNKGISNDQKEISLKSTLKDINYLKESNLSEAEKNRYIDILSKDQLGQFRQAAKNGTGLEGKKLGQQIAEHNPPIEKQKAIIKEYVNNKSDISKAEIEEYLRSTRVHFLPKEATDLLPKEDLPGKPRYKDPGFLAGIGRYLENHPDVKLIDVEEMGWESPEKFYEAVEASKKLYDSGVISYESREAAVKNNAVTNSLDNKYTEEKRKIRVFDFDDTLGKTTNKVLYTMPDGTRGELTGAEFAEKAGELANDGAEFDFSDFAKVNGGKPGPLFSVAKTIAEKRGTSNLFILTARPADAAGPIQEFLSTFGLDVPLENITGLGDSRAQAKADWITRKASEGYNDFYFADDHLPNVKAVKDALDVLDVKGRVQQAKAKFSRNLDAEFNKIIEENKGVEDYKKFSDIVARRRGAGKNKFDLYVPPSAADFELLLYNFMGKGSKGEAQKKFFTDALIKPYINGNDLMDGARQSIKNDYKGLISSFPDVAKKLEKLTPDGDFTYDQAIRVAMWNEEGVEIPGISQRDSNKLTDLVNNNAELNAFKQGLIVTGRQGRGWIKPGEYWDSTTIISDLHNLTEGEGRKKFLGEFIENAEQIFGTWENDKLVGPNMNKIEAVYGTNVREALEDSVYRMTSGKNRGVGRDKETTMWSNWVNGSTGTIMFLNTRSAALQLLGAVNFLNLRDNNPIAAAKAFANQPQYWKDFAQIWNSDKMKERRGGLKEDVAAAEIANAAAGSKNKVNAVVSYLLKIGYTPTQLADSFAIASGGAPYYRNRIKTYLKEGKTQTEAENLAWEDFSKVSDETQQSGDPKDISKQQASPAGRLLLTFQNTAMQQSRIVKKAVLDLKNGRGDAKTNVAKIAYYIGIQNTMFAVLQQGLFAVAFDDTGDKDKPEKEKKMNEKMLDVVDGVIDTVLRGSGFAGGVVATLKNMGKKYFEEKEKGFKADNAKVMLEGANISPPIGSKLRKLYTGLQQTKFEKDLIKERGWDVMQDGRVHLGPMYGVTGKLAESFANIPMDRMVNKIENASQALNSQNETWQRVMVGMGWSPYSAGIDDTPGDEKIRAEAKEQRRVEGKEKAKETRERTRDSIKSLPFGEQLRLKREAKMKRRKMG